MHIILQAGFEIIKLVGFSGVLWWRAPQINCAFLATVSGYIISLLITNLRWLNQLCHILFFFHIFFHKSLSKTQLLQQDRARNVLHLWASHGFRMSSEAMQGWKASKPWLGLLAHPLNSGSREPVGRIIQEKPRDSSTPVVLRLAGHCSCRTPEQNQGWKPWKTSPDEGSVL